MKQMPLIAVVFNEPTVATVDGRKFLSEAGQIGGMAGHADVISTVAPGMLDLSEVGVIEAREHVEQALRAEGFQTTLLNINGDLKRLIDFLRDAKPDIIFNLCEGVRNLAIHEMHIAGIFELLGVPYTGAGSFALGTALNKVRTKEVLSYHGIPTARFAMFKSLAEFDASTVSLTFPAIVKPSREDASIGIENGSVVRDRDALRTRIKHVIETHMQPALAEEYIEGRELNVAIMGTESPVALPISGDRFFRTPG
jgi:D-alanine-D-alanine ligase